jgi:hypothetical protein
MICIVCFVRVSNNLTCKGYTGADHRRIALARLLSADWRDSFFNGHYLRTLQTADLAEIVECYVKVTSPTGVILTAF